MAQNKTLKEQAFYLYVYSARDMAEIATVMKKQPSTIEKWKRDDKKQGKNWDVARSSHITDKEVPSDVHAALNLAVKQARMALEGIEKEEDLKPEKRAALVASIMDTLAKAASTAKKISPEIDKEQIILNVVQIISDEIVNTSPELTHIWLHIMDEVQSKINQQKINW